MKTSTYRLNREIDEALDRRKKVEALRRLIQRLLAKWQPRLGVHVQTWRIKDAEDYWATMDEHQSEIWFSAHLAETLPAFIEVIVVHELVHYLTHGHDPEFFELLDRHMPGWRRIHALYDEVPTLHSK
jgi:predicted metal-dependent hydrolase